MSLPQSTVNTILKRVKKRGYIRLQDGVYYRNAEQLERLEFSDIRQSVIEEHDSLFKEFVRFCSSRFGIGLSLEDADAAL